MMAFMRRKRKADFPLPNKKKTNNWTFSQKFSPILIKQTHSNEATQLTQSKQWFSVAQTNRVLLESKTLELKTESLTEQLEIVEKQLEIGEKQLQPDKVKQRRAISRQQMKINNNNFAMAFSLIKMPLREN